MLAVSDLSTIYVHAAYLFAQIRSWAPVYIVIDPPESLVLDRPFAELESLHRECIFWCGDETVLETFSKFAVHVSI